MTTKTADKCCRGLSKAIDVAHECPSEVRDTPTLGSSGPNACAPTARIGRHGVNGMQKRHYNKWL